VCTTEAIHAEFAMFGTLGEEATQGQLKIIASASLLAQRWVLLHW